MGRFDLGLEADITWVGGRRFGGGDLVPSDGVDGWFDEGMAVGG